MAAADQRETKPAAGVMPMFQVSREMAYGVMIVHTNESGDGAFAATNHGEFLAVLKVVHHDPADDTSGCRGVGVKGGEHSSETGVKS